MPGPAQDPPVQGTQSFSRSIAVLQHIADRAEPPEIRDLIDECHLTRPTLYRLLAGLEAEDLIVQTRDRRYKTGPRLVSLARTALAHSDVREVALDDLKALRDQTGETVHLALPGKNGMVYIDKIESHETVRMRSTVGTVVPLHSSSVGKAYLAALTDQDLAKALQQTRLEPITAFTTTEPGALRGQLEACRSDGYAFEFQENEIGIACFGAAIRDDRGTPVAAVSVSVPLFRLKEDKDHYTPALLRCVRAISLRLGNAG